MRFTTRADVPLDGDVDATLVPVPSEATVKGMFFTRYVAALGPEWEAIVPELVAPARHGRYHAFEAYPLVDYHRVFDRVARARFPGSPREAYRLLARGEVEVFSSSTLGAVAFSLMKDPAGALLRFPELYKIVTVDTELTAVRAGDRRVIVTHTNYRGFYEVGLGLVEGLVQTFDEVPAVEVTIDDGRKVTFDVSW